MLRFYRARAFLGMFSRKMVYSLALGLSSVLLLCSIFSGKELSMDWILRPGDRSCNLVRKPCGCDTCVSERGKCPWFDSHFDNRISPFLSPMTIFTLDTLVWWLNLQNSRENELNPVLQKLFQVVPNTEWTWAPDPARCRRCAVVGNSGHLLHSNLGQLISSHDYVFRMNRGKTRGYEADVGNKTTHHIMYPESAQDLDKGVHLVLLPFKVQDLHWLASALSTGEIKRTYTRVKTKIQTDRDKIVVINPSFFHYVYRNWTNSQGKYPSTGLLAIMLAVHMCDQVSVFGYGADKLGNWHHYWENNTFGGAFRKTGVHNADNEMEIIQKLHDIKKVTFYKEQPKKVERSVRHYA
ncbi:ST3 beta-galactoside alpha-2,3-sialyltransferase 8 [Erpetoichthys calabaricus]|uniref:ST3 beta-galactoside alpha-2,3-sialyltransferase 8 n=1 Tax=Erpetoichthys calabaricus TaxID=27687 RepID=UPI0022348C2F|nr:ST3 beta-galactoside alpha-2,3-sialyltransferase 8 [Erpetoichthys calabaricus]